MMEVPPRRPIPNAPASSDSTSLKLSFSAPARAMTNRSRAGCNSLRVFRKNSRTSLVTRVLRTASPTFRLTVTPSLHSGPGPRSAITTKCGVFEPRCPRCSRTKSARARRRRCGGNARSELPPRALGRRSDDKTLAALCSPVLEDVPSSGRLHARQESVDTSPSQIARLIRSFHVGPTER